MNEAVFKRRLSSREDSRCCIDRHCNDVCAVCSLIRSGLFLPVPEWWCTYECLRLLFVARFIVLAYYTNLVISFRASELIFLIALFDFCVCTLVSLRFTAHTDSPAGSSRHPTGV